MALARRRGANWLTREPRISARGSASRERPMARASRSTYSDGCSRRVQAYSILARRIVRSKRAAYWHGWRGRGN